jgi:ADP-dependent NAD(P)H-hydrate dehydratase
MRHADPKLIDLSLLRSMPLPRPDPEQGKVGRGKLLLVAGSPGLPGAAILAARAALRVGCGTVRVATPRSIAAAVGVAVPELMVVPLPEDGDAASLLDGLRDHIDASNAAVIGPGMVHDAATTAFAAAFLSRTPLPTVVDAGALSAWLYDGVPAGAGLRVLTPHVGEMSRLAGMDAGEIAGRRAEIAGRYAEEWGAVLVLKGAETYISGAGLYLNRAGSDGLGTAGSGDVLAGVIGGLLARGADPTTAAVWGVHLHALAGESAAGRLGDDGMMASDVVEALPGAMLKVGGRGT